MLAVAGTLRAVDELTAVHDLWSTGYGRAMLAKIALLAVIAGIALRSRRRARAAARDLVALRRTTRGELGLATGALALAALLGTIAPPIAVGIAAPALSATGADFAPPRCASQLTAASAEPGANAFEARVADYDSGEPVRGARVRLRFEPLDDPGVAATSLSLARRGDLYAGSGANLAFDGRWRVTALVQRGRDAVEVPLELDVPGPEHFITVRRMPGRAPVYSAQVIGVGYVRISPDPERAGPSTVAVDVFTVFEDFADIDALVVTARRGPRAPRGSAGPPRAASAVASAPRRRSPAARTRSRSTARDRAGHAPACGLRARRRPPARAPSSATAGRASASARVRSRAVSNWLRTVTRRRRVVSRIV